MDKPIALTLGKLLVAVAWADGELQDEELQILKDLVYKIPNLSRDDWASIEVYMDSPITATECAQLMRKFKNLISTEEDKTFAIQAIRDIITADGEIDENERRLHDLIVSEIQEASVGFDKKIEGLFSGARQKRRQNLGSVPRRERNLDEYLENPIFFRTFNKLTEEGIILHMDKAELEQLCVAGSLLACIAQADGEIHPNEKALIPGIIRKYWKVSEEAALVMAEIAVDHKVAGMDILRMCRKFYADNDLESRTDFFRALVALVKSDYDVHPNERERLRSIAVNLKLPQEMVMELVPRVGPIAEDDAEVPDFSLDSVHGEGDDEAGSGLSEASFDSEEDAAYAREQARLAEEAKEAASATDADKPSPRAETPAFKKSKPRFQDI